MHFNFEDLLDIVSSHQVLTIYLALFLVLLVLYKRKTLQKKYKLPPGPTGLPIVGYLPFLGQEPYKKLNGLKKKYGSVFSIQMGMTRVVILGDFEAVSEAFSKPACNGRPHGIFDFAPNGAGFAGANGEEWSEQRKFCIKSMREYGVGRNKWEWIVETEASDLVSLIFSYNGEPLDVGKIMVSSISNNLSTYLLGRRLPLNHPDRIFLDKATEEIFAFYTKSSFLPYFPVIRYICAAIGMGSDAKTMKTMVLCNNLFRKEVEKMKESYEKSDDDNFIVHYQEEMDNYKGKTGHYFNEKNLLGTVGGLFLAGSDTTAVSVMWILIAMAKFPDIQAKVQQEIDSVFGNGGRIQWSDRKKLPYTHATILKTQRWRTISHLGLVRMAMEDFQVQNYDIPKGTPIMANIWALHNDPIYWKEPEKFEPKRFLTEDGKEVIVKPDSYIPFSYGKRGCPGEVVAMIELLIYFTSIMQQFTIMVPEGKTVNVEPKTELPSHPYPQELQFIPREK